MKNLVALAVIGLMVAGCEKEEEVWAKAYEEGRSSGVIEARADIFRDMTDRKWFSVQYLSIPYPYAISVSNGFDTKRECELHVPDARCDGGECHRICTEAETLFSSKTELRTLKVSPTMPVTSTIPKMIWIWEAPELCRDNADGVLVCPGGQVVTDKWPVRRDIISPLRTYQNTLPSFGKLKANGHYEVQDE